MKKILLLISLLLLVSSGYSKKKELVPTWITNPVEVPQDKYVTHLFRADFKVNDSIFGAELKVAATGKFLVSINGNFVILGGEPTINTDKPDLYTVRVDSFLQEGHNSIALELLPLKENATSNKSCYFELSVNNLIVARSDKSVRCYAFMAQEFCAEPVLFPCKFDASLTFADNWKLPRFNERKFSVDEWQEAAPAGLFDINAASVHKVLPIHSTVRASNIKFPLVVKVGEQVNSEWNSSKHGVYRFTIEGPGEKEILYTIESGEMKLSGKYITTSGQQTFVIPYFTNARGFSLTFPCTYKLVDISFLSFD